MAAVNAEQSWASSWAFGERPTVLQAPEVELRAIDLDAHGPGIYAALQRWPEELWHFTTGHPLPETYSHWVESKRQLYSEGATQTFAIFDTSKKADEPALAGYISVLDASKARLTCQIGITVWPTFHRSHVHTQAQWACLRWLLDPIAENGLGMRRVTYGTFTHNAVSLKSALRIGYQFEGVRRNYLRIAPEFSQRYGRRLPGTSYEDGSQADAYFLVITSDDWQESVRAHLEKLAFRPV